MKCSHKQRCGLTAILIPHRLSTLSTFLYPSGFIQDRRWIRWISTFRRFAVATISLPEFELVSPIPGIWTICDPYFWPRWLLSRGRCSRWGLNVDVWSLVIPIVASLSVNAGISIGPIAFGRSAHIIAPSTGRSRAASTARRPSMSFVFAMIVRASATVTRLCVLVSYLECSVVMAGAIANVVIVSSTLLASRRTVWRSASRATGSSRGRSRGRVLSDVTVNTSVISKRWRCLCLRF